MRSTTFRSSLAALIALMGLSTTLGASELPAGITVTGEAELRLVPDRAELKLAVEQRADSADQAMEAAGRVADRFLKAARDVGAGPDQIRSTDVQVMPEYRWNEERGEREQTGFLARRDIQLRVVEMGRLPDYLRAAAATGMTHVSPPEMQLSNPAKARQQTLADATRDAQQSAQAIAEAAGRELGDLIALDAEPERSGSPGPVAMRTMAESSRDDAGGGVSVGEIVHAARVRARFALSD
jgi:hypothetical protein